VVAGYFFASEPTIYKRGMVMLLPRDQQGRTEAALGHVGAGLFDWLKGQLVSMVIVGLLIGLGSWLIGLPAPLALGLFAGLFAFVPVIGPIVGAVPALALAAAQDGATLLWTAGLILVVEQVESNMIMPLVGQHTVHIPPALLMLNVFLFGALFGGVGVVVAAPLTVAVFVLVKKLYVVDVLDQKVDLPGT
jgi:predicted PurR-regulated permease PerM